MDKKKERKKFIIRLIIGSIFFGLVICGDNIFINGTLQISGISWLLYSSVSFGVIFYLFSRFSIFKSLWKDEKTKDNEY